MENCCRQKKFINSVSIVFTCQMRCRGGPQVYRGLLPVCGSGKSEKNSKVREFWKCKKKSVKFEKKVVIKIGKIASEVWKQTNIRACWSAARCAISLLHFAPIVRFLDREKLKYGWGKSRISNSKVHTSRDFLIGITKWNRYRLRIALSKCTCKIAADVKTGQAEREKNYGKHSGGRMF